MCCVVLAEAARVPRVANALPTRRTAGLGGVKHIHLDIRHKALNTVPQYHCGSKSRTNGKRFLSRISRAHRWRLGARLGHRCGATQGMHLPLRSGGLSPRFSLHTGPSRWWPALESRCTAHATCAIVVLPSCYFKEGSDGGSGLTSL